MNITIEEINKGIIPRARANGNTGEPCDVFISVSSARSKSATAYIYYYFPEFKKYNYVVLSKVGNKLFFRPTNTDTGNNAYTISRKKTTTLSTTVSGQNAKLLKTFAGRYFIKQYDWRQTARQPIYYITLEDKLNA